MLTGDTGEAEELLQESMTRALERWDRVAVMANPVGWVYRVASNLNRRRFRRRKRDATSVAPSASREMADAVEARLDALQLLRSLSGKELEVLILTEWLGLKTGEAAAALGIASSSVRGRLHRARLTLRERTEASDG